MKTFQVKAVGIVSNAFNDPADYHKIKEKTSSIIIDDEYSKGLLNIKDCEYLDIVFWFHKSAGFTLSGKTFSGAERGVFAPRSPKRPNAIGVTTVKLLECNKNKIIVEGLDAINNTPVIDIKCCDTSLFASVAESDPVQLAILKSDPRIEIRNNIVSGKTDTLLIKAAQLHGHFCPGLAMGVMAAAFAMRELKVDSDGMENLLAITETNNCFADGVQFVTGCSFGNNALIFKDIGKTAFTLTKRDGEGIRLCSRHESRDIIEKAFPDFQKYYQLVIIEQNRDAELVAAYKRIALQRAFGTLHIPLKKLFTVIRLHVNIPDYAPIHESVVCSVCHESVMKSKTTEKEDSFICFTCNHSNYGFLDGFGIHF
ncbi:MAG: SAM-dependent methyltransferase [Bacteroidales bacterium]|nr:SAM-dependent methyltransferase [Bacteroidales bacterium]